MTGREAKRIACSVAGEILSSTGDVMEFLLDRYEGDDLKRMERALDDLAAELKRRGKGQTAGRRRNDDREA